MYELPGVVPSPNSLAGPKGILHYIKKVSRCGRTHSNDLLAHRIGGAVATLHDVHYDNNDQSLREEAFVVSVVWE